jgi:hypothetical protein
MLLHPPLVQCVQPLLERLLVCIVERRYIASCSREWQQQLAKGAALACCQTADH